MSTTFRLLCAPVLGVALIVPCSESASQNSGAATAPTSCCGKKKEDRGTCSCFCQATDSSTEFRGQGGRGRRGGLGKKDHLEDMQTFQYLLSHRKEITRKVTLLARGVETITESKNPQVASRIQEHVAAMARRVKEGRPIHQRDPLFRELFRHADRIQMRIENTTQGARVWETSEDAYVVLLIQAHARVVSAFLENGHEEVRKDHAVPPRPGK